MTSLPNTLNPPCFSRYALGTTAICVIAIPVTSTTPQQGLSGVPFSGLGMNPGTEATLETTARISTGDGLSRRQLLQRRMPKRAQIQAIIDLRPARDPWLDDQYDWRP